MWLYSVGRASSRVQPVFLYRDFIPAEIHEIQWCVSVLAAGDELDNNDGHVSCVQVSAK